MIPLAIPKLDGNEARYLQECIDTTYVSSVGPFVTRFETALAQACGAAGSVLTSSGTTALHIALLSLGIGPGDLVVLPDMTFIGSANAISHTGASPWLLDVDAENWCLDPVVLRRSLAEECERGAAGLMHKATGRRVAAILPVYVLGTPADMDAICAIGAEYGLPVVADAAAAIGATYKGRPIGALGAQLTMISFNGNKTITSGGGGAVLANDKALLQHVGHLTTTARRGPGYDHDEIGYNYRMTNLQAAVGVAQLERLEEFVAKKRHIRKLYNGTFANHSAFSLYPEPEWAESPCWLSGVITRDAGTAEALVAHLQAQQIEARPFWKPISTQKPYLAAPRGANPVAAQLWRRVVTLPSSVAMSDAEQGQVIDGVFSFLKSMAA